MGERDHQEVPLHLAPVPPPEEDGLPLRPHENAGRRGDDRGQPLEKAGQGASQGGGRAARQGRATCHSVVHGDRAGRERGTNRGDDLGDQRVEAGGGKRRGGHRGRHGRGRGRGRGDGCGAWRGCDDSRRRRDRRAAGRQDRRRSRRPRRRRSRQSPGRRGRNLRWRGGAHGHAGAKAPRGRLADVPQHGLEAADLPLEGRHGLRARRIFPQGLEPVRLALDRGQALAEVADDLAEGLRELDVRTDGAVKQLLRDRADLRPHLAGVGGLRSLGLGDHHARGRGRRRDGGRGRRLAHDGLERLGDDLRDGLRVEPLLLEVVLERDGGQHVLHDGGERLHDTLAAGGDRGEGLPAPEVQRAVELRPAG